MFSRSWCSMYWKINGLHNGLPFLPERINIGKLEKLVIHIEYVIHIRNLKQALNHGLVLKKEWLSLIKMLGRDVRYEHWSKKKSKKMILNKFWFCFD